MSSELLGTDVLVGEASGSVDPLTGEGLGLAFQQASALAEALANQDLSYYQTAHQRIQRLPVLMSKLLLAMGRHAWLRRQMLKTLAKEPQLSARLLVSHVGAFSAIDFGVGNILKLGRGLLVNSS
jgi:flavin-dependent dehydrogenase